MCWRIHYGVGARLSTGLRATAASIAPVLAPGAGLTTTGQLRRFDDFYTQRRRDVFVQLDLDLAQPKLANRLV